MEDHSINKCCKTLSHDSLKMYNSLLTQTRSSFYNMDSRDLVLFKDYRRHETYPALIRVPLPRVATIFLNT